MDELRPLRVGEVLDVALKIYRERFGTLVRAVAVVVIPVAVLVALVQISIPEPTTGAPGSDPFAAFEPGAEPFDPGAEPFDPEADPFDPEADPFVPGSEGEFEVEVDPGALAATLLSFLLTWLATTLATAACFAIVSGAYLDRDTSWRDSVRFARSRLGPLIWLYTVYGVLLFLATLALVVPGVYLFVAWAVAVPVLLFEDVRGGKALRRSRELLKGRWWATLAVLVLVAILTIVVQAAITAALVGVFAFGGGEVAAVIASGIAEAVGNMLTIPFAAAATAVLYFDALVRKEAFDLTQLAEAVESPPSADDRGWPPGSPAPSGSPPAGDAPPSWPPPPDWRPSG